MPITDFSNRAVIIPSIEAVEEAKFRAIPMTREIGRTSGGLFNTTLRSGSNTLHGVLQGETRQTNWGANLLQQPDNSRAGPLSYYSYVGSLSGGPIPLPKILGGKHKPFSGSPKRVTGSALLRQQHEVCRSQAGTAQQATSPELGNYNVATSHCDAGCPRRYLCHP